MIELAHRYIIPAAFSILPAAMASNEAHAMLLAIGLQESRFRERRQHRGPARGFWQFEEGGVRGVLEHESTHVAIAQAMVTIRYDHTLDPDLVLAALEFSDVLAAAFARCLLWTHPDRMPGPAGSAEAWAIYLDTWRPGKPRRETWGACYSDAWTLTLGGRLPAPILKA